MYRTARQFLWERYRWPVIRQDMFLRTWKIFALSLKASNAQPICLLNFPTKSLRSKRCLYRWFSLFFITSRILQCQFKIAFSFTAGRTYLTSDVLSCNNEQNCILFFWGEDHKGVDQRCSDKSPGVNTSTFGGRSIKILSPRQNFVAATCRTKLNQCCSDKILSRRQNFR